MCSYYVLMFKLPDTIPDTLRAELEIPLGLQGRSNPADLWPYIKAWLVKDGLEVHCRTSGNSDDQPNDDDRKTE